ncbi:hypothetical protein [Streptacidiphilus fuscans]|uniref:Uncharacterized protein n=1 Tax=Streptacidiphilus fuscans TaxID=2789292 RepID=A0A931AX21_9ACTN|nr:hypothetical protein [Streptacidiphilus fuscans]MBF9066444.1 hypothetical protein [Streptacidiphilus fuscans]
MLPTSLRDQLDILDQRAADLETARRLLRRTIAVTEDAEDAARVELAEAVDACAAALGQSRNVIGGHLVGD